MYSFEKFIITLTVSLETVTSMVSSLFSAHDVTGAVCAVSALKCEKRLKEYEILP